MSTEQRMTIKLIKNLTNIPYTTDLRDYLDWLDENYPMNRPINSYQSMTTPSIYHKNSENKMKMNSFLSIIVSFFA